MFEEYIKDSEYFFRKAETNIDHEVKKRYFRASIFCSSNSIESFINQVAAGIDLANILDKNESAYLNDKVIEIVPSRGETKLKSKYNPLIDKIKFLVKKYNVEIEIAVDSNWQKFLNTKTLRDKLVHSKDNLDDLGVVDYLQMSKDGLNCSIYILDKLSKKIFQSGLRRGLLELKIDDS